MRALPSWMASNLMDIGGVQWGDFARVFRLHRCPIMVSSGRMVRARWAAFGWLGHRYRVFCPTGGSVLSSFLPQMTPNRVGTVGCHHCQTVDIIYIHAMLVM